MTHIVYGDKGGNMIEILRGNNQDTPEGLKEAKELMRQMESWKEDYASRAAPGAEFLYNDFLEEIEEHLIPHVQRLVDLSYISMDTRSAILAFAYEKAEEIKDLIASMSAIRTKNEADFSAEEKLRAMSRLLNGVSVEKVAAELNCDVTIIIGWKNEFLQNTGFFLKI